jgi:hypothetical protein
MLILPGEPGDDSYLLPEPRRGMGGVIDRAAVHDPCARRRNDRILGVVANIKDIVSGHEDTF